MKKTLLFLAAAFVSLCGFAQGATVPADAVTEQWTAKFVMHYQGSSGEQTENINEPMDVAFAGNDVYFNLPNPFTGNTWVKGTRNADVVTFQKGQYIGSYGGSVYMVGQNESGICDVLFDYNESQGVFSLNNMQIVMSSSATAIDAWAYFTDMVVTKDDSGELTGLNAPPAGTPTEAWTMTCTEDGEQSTYDVKLAIVGNQMYLQGVSFQDAWVVGTIEGSQVTFPKQFVGSYSGYDLYFAAYVGGEGVIDAVLDYDAEGGRLTTVQNLVLATNDGYAMGMMSDVVILRNGGDEPADKPVVAPEGLATEEYVFKGTSIKYDADGTVAGMEPVQWNVRVGFSGSDVYIQGLCQLFPDAWVKGTLDDGEVTFAAGQFYGQHPVITSSLFYFAGQIFGELSEVVMSFDNTDRVFRSGSYYVLLNSEKSVMAPYEVYAGVTITRIPNVAAQPAAPVVESYEAFNDEYQYGYVCLTLPTQDVDGNAILMDKMSYRMYVEQQGQQSLYTFSPVLYKELTEPTDEIAYMYADGYDFYRGGSFIALYEESKQWDKIGFQTVYRGGNAVSESPITWYTIKTTAIDSAVTGSDILTEDCYDLQGRRVAPGTRGLVITSKGKRFNK